LGEQSDETLARAFGTQRPEGLEAVYAAYGRALFSVARNIFGNDDDAQDCVHDVLLRVWRRPESFRSERGSLRSFLMACIRNEALTRLRDAARHRRIELKAVVSKPEAYDFEVRDVVETERVRRALATLPQEQRSALALAYAEHLSHREIAERLNVPLGTIKSRLALGLRRLKSQLGPQEVTA